MYGNFLTPHSQLPLVFTPLWRFENTHNAQAPNVEITANMSMTDWPIHMYVCHVRYANPRVGTGAAASTVL